MADFSLPNGEGEQVSFDMECVDNIWYLVVNDHELYDIPIDEERLLFTCVDVCSDYDLFKRDKNADVRLCSYISNRLMNDVSKQLTDIAEGEHPMEGVFH